MQTIQIKTWAAFKAICIVQKNLNCQYADNDAAYELYGPDCGAILWCASIAKDSGDDQQDFEANYKASFNYSIGQRSYPFATPDVQFAGKGFSGIAKAGQTTDIWFLLADGHYLSGGEYWTRGAAAGDTMQVDIVDKDGLYSPAGTVLVAPPYLKAWNVLPKDDTLVKFERNYAGKPPPGVYARFRYVSIGEIDVPFFCNLYLHKPL